MEDAVHQGGKVEDIANILKVWDFD